jgi:hypothetical protein
MKRILREKWEKLNDGSFTQKSVDFLVQFKETSKP